MQAIASGIVINFFVEFDFAHELANRGKVEDDVLFGKGIFVNRIAGRTEDNQPRSNSFAVCQSDCIRRVAGSTKSLNFQNYPSFLIVASLAL